LSCEAAFVASGHPRQNVGFGWKAKAMAKALHGHFATNDARLGWENDRLRSRIAELETEVARLTAKPAASVEELALPDAFADGMELRPALA